MKIALFITKDVVASSVIGILDFVDFANRLAPPKSAPLTVEVISINPEPVVSSQGLVIPAKWIGDHPEESEFAYIWFLGSRYAGTELLRTQALDAALHKTLFKSFAGKAQHIAASCTGVAVMAEVLELEHKNITASWWLGRYFAEFHPTLKLSLSNRHARDGKFITSGATNCYQNLVLSMIQTHYGHAVAQQLCKWLAISPLSYPQLQFADIAVLERQAGRAMAPVVAYIHANLAEELSNQRLADIAATTPRTLLRQFKRYFAMTPAEYVRLLRLEKTRELIMENAYSLAKIASLVGYQDEKALAKLFAKHFGVSVTQARKGSSTLL
ncbi:GlxA family transcriptional regulator [Pseudoalteromonas fenneropenaei]|uniref:GlxA family transcriptional regulator n=1 Tax=Pseudoalteromonas fenneropenaei TaxID=1737459 RepID=A0ABV7CF43_9GAMM